jgi:hypothetical protein
MTHAERALDWLCLLPEGQQKEKDLSILSRGYDRELTDANNGGGGPEVVGFIDGSRLMYIETAQRYFIL